MIIGIVADDLTGAADAVAPFAARGYRAIIDFVAGRHTDPEPLDADARAWTTFNRDQTDHTDAARRRGVRAAVRRAQMLGASLLYQKIDSTLRGYLRSDLDSMRTEARGRIAVVCPAFPANGRTVRGGVLCVNGEGRQSVQSAFEMQEDHGALPLPLESLRRESDLLPDRLLEWKSNGVHTVFCDAESVGDLAILARAILATKESVLPVGSAGLTGAIAEQMPQSTRAGPTGPSVREALRTGRVLVTVGSMNPVSRRQARHLSHVAGIEPVVLSADGPTETIGPTILGKFGDGARIVLMQTPDVPVDEPIAETLPGSLFFVRLRMTVADLGFVMTGGETAAAMLRSYGCLGIEIEGEFSAGVVTGRLRGSRINGSKIDGMPVLLKAGGFGDEEMLAHCLGL